ncbi:hypothetical protein A9Q99_25455 [Gammaproteobacteria bacterium 45_16_T64]|nr:hypothetical protein A9Q99_25455 [Gammaproteobacteria bacterium 45_16_T64]
MLTEQLVLEKTSDGTYQRQCDRVWWGQGSLLGGYVQSLMLSAMTQELQDETKPALTLHTQFLRPVTDESIRIDVVVERSGRKLSNLRASLYCGDRLAVVSSGLFGQQTASHDFCAIEMPRYPKIGSTESAQLPNVGLDAHNHFDFFPRIGSFERDKGQAHVAGWLQPSWQHTLNNELLALVADLWVPAAFHYWPSNIGVVGLDSYIQFRSNPNQLRDNNEPLLLSLDTKQASNGYVDEDGLIWSSSGELLCQYRQMRLVLDM